MDKEFYIGQIFDGIYPAQAAFWCKRNNAQIETKTRIDIIDGYEVETRYYEIIATPEMSVEQKQSRVRGVRDAYINGVEWRVSRYRDQAELGIETTDTQGMYIQILSYMQYLRDYPESAYDWYERNPLTLDEWLMQ